MGAYRALGMLIAAFCFVAVHGRVATQSDFFVDETEDMSKVPVVEAQGNYKQQLRRERAAERQEMMTQFHSVIMRARASRSAPKQRHQNRARVRTGVVSRLKGSHRGTTTRRAKLHPLQMTTTQLRSPGPVSTQMQGEMTMREANAL